MAFFRKLENLIQLLQQSLREFRKNDPLRMAAATAFFATFALPAILIILIQVFGLIMSRRTIGFHLLESLSDVIGRNTAMELRETLRNVRRLAHTWYIAAGGFVFLIFVSTTLFKVIKDSLNQLWGIRVTGRQNFSLVLKQRGKSFLAILAAGLLFFVTLLTEGLAAVLREYILRFIPADEWLVNGILSQLISLLVVTTWFSMLFRFLADGHTTWRVTFGGAFFTGLLFTLGKFLLRFLLSYSKMHTIYGTSTSFVLLLLFIFYCSFIFYFGACFTKIWAQHRQEPIRPGRNAQHFTISAIDAADQ